MKHNIEKQRFERQIETGPVAFLSYSQTGNQVTFDHTFVPEELRGRGIAAELTRAALAEARQRGWKVIPRCTYVAAYIERHPEYADLLEGQGSAGRDVQKSG